MSTEIHNREGLTATMQDHLLYCIKLYTKQLQREAERWTRRLSIIEENRSHLVALPSHPDVTIEQFGRSITVGYYAESVEVANTLRSNIQSLYTSVIPKRVVRGDHVAFHLSITKQIDVVIHNAPLAPGCFLTPTTQTYTTYKISCPTGVDGEEVE